MQLSTVITIVFAAVAIAMPAPQDDAAAAAAGDAVSRGEHRGGGSRPKCYNQCVASRSCIAAYPQSCHCWNNVRKDCAIQCHVPPPRPEKCPSIKPPVGEDCIGGSYGSCIGAYMCTAQYPQGCHCMNGVKVRCAEACNAGRPKLEECPPITVGVVEEPTQVVDPPAEETPATACKCAKPQACLMSWPESCHCEVDQRKKCAELCGHGWDDEKERAKCGAALESAKL